MVRLLPFSLLFLIGCAVEFTPTTPPPYRPGMREEIMVYARDGVPLATFVALPRTPGPYPAILVRTPYGKGGGAPFQIGGIADVFVPHGFAVVEQDVRGRFGSGGEFVPLLNDRNDTEDTLKWLARQPWFNGNLGVWGASYLGLTALMAAVLRPDLVKAAFIAVIRSDLYAVAYEHGLPRADVMGLWALGIRGREGLELPSSAILDRILLEFPLADADIRTGERLPYAQLFLKNDTDGPFWRTPLDPEEWHKSSIPTYFFTGWQDFMVAGTLRDYEERRKTPVRAHLFLMVGPWTHLMLEIPPQEYRFPEASGIPFIMGEVVEFFERYLKGESQKFQVPPVRYYDGGKRTWVSSTTLFPENPNLSRLYFQPLTTSCPHGLLSPGAPQGALRELSYLYNPYDPVILNGAAVLDAARGGMHREISWCSRSDALLFVSDPLSEPLPVAGGIQVHLKVRTRAPDAAVLARLILITPEGEWFNLREGAMLLSYRGGDFAPLPVTPDTPFSLTLPLPPLRWTVPPGSRLALALTSSGVPFIPPYTNTGPGWVFSPIAVTTENTYTFDDQTYLELTRE